MANETTNNAKFTPLILFLIQIVLFVIFHAGLIGIIELLVPIVILIIFQIVILSRPLDNISFKKNIKRYFVVICIYITVPVLLLLNLWKVDYAGTYLVVRMTEQNLLRKAEMTSINHSDSNALFKYFRIDFGRVSENKRWIVYDESDQVSLDYLTRSADWKRASKESAEREACSSNGRKLYSHYYVQYSGC